MCSNYTLNVRDNELQELIGTSELKVAEINQRFLPYQSAPVVVRGSRASYQLASMNFSLVPSWSKEAKVKFATHNARIETVTEKPTWKVPFLKQHCLVPMTGFFESAYEGPHSGHIIQFSEKKDQLLVAAGIYDQWKNPETKKITHSFSILTTTPTSFIMEYGHDRSPIFLNPARAKAWLDVNEQSDRFWLDYIISEGTRPELKVSIDRALKPGWEKRK